MSKDEAKRDDSYDVLHTVIALGGYVIHHLKGGKWVTDEELRELTTPKED